MSFQPPIYTFSVVSLYPSSGKSCLCKRLIDSNWDNYQSFLNGSIVEKPEKTNGWFYWGSIKHRRFDEKREAIFHFIEQPSLTVDDEEQIDGQLKRLSTLTFRFDEKSLTQNKRFPKEKVTVDGFLCIFDCSSQCSLTDFISLIHVLLKTRRPVLLVTTKNDLIEDQLSMSQQFEQSIHLTFANLSIVHTSSHEHVNIQSVLELALYACDETTRKSNVNKFQAPNYLDAWKNEQSLKHVIQTEYRTLLNRHVPDFRVSSWEKFYDRWQHHTTVQTFFDMFGKEQGQCLYHEHIDEMKRIYREKLLDERFVPIIEMLIADPKVKLSRNWDFVRTQMQKHPRYSSTVIETSRWSDFERNSTSLCIPEDLLNTGEARQRFELYVNQRQLEQTRRLHCRSFFDLLNRFAEAGLVHYGDSYEKDCVYFLGRECYEALNSQDRLRIFSLHQSYLYRLLCLQFVELLLESLQIFIQTFDKMNLATKLNDEKMFRHRKMTTLTIDEIFQKEIIEQIKHDPRYQALNKRETDRHRLIMCHCHFLYDCIYYPSMPLLRSFQQRRRSFKRRKSSSNNDLILDENFCPYTRRTTAENNNENSSTTKTTASMHKRDFQISCPMENKCADLRIINELVSKLKLKPMKKNIFLFGDVDDVNRCYETVSTDSSFVNDFPFHFLTVDSFQKENLDGCLLVTPHCEDQCRKFLSDDQTQVDVEQIPMIELFESSEDSSTMELCQERLRISLDRLVLAGESLIKKKLSIDLRILVCFMCGGEKNDVEILIDHLASRFTLSCVNQSSFLINVVVGRANRKIEFVCVSFHSLFDAKLLEFDGFIFLFDHDRTAAVHTMAYLQRHVSNVFENENSQRNVHQPPIYLLSCTRDVSLSSMRKSSHRNSQNDSSVQYHQGSIKNFVEAHLFLFLHQCWTVINEKSCNEENEQTEHLLASVQSYFDKSQDTRSNDPMTHSFDLLSLPLNNQNRMVSSLMSSKSNEHSPKHRHSSLTPTNQEQIFSYRSYPHLSQTHHGAESTIVPTTPIDPSTGPMSVVSSTSISTNSTSENQQQLVQKSTSMRFAKLMEHPTNGTSSPMTNGTSPYGRRSSVDEMKFHFSKHRSTTAQVKVPLATPEIVELNELLASPYSYQPRHNETSSSSMVEHPANEPIHVESSVDSSSDERVLSHRQTGWSLQRKSSDRKSKRLRAKPTDTVGLASSSEILKKPSDDDILQETDKQSQKKKRRPSVRRRKKNSNDPTQTDSGIDSRMDSKDSNKVSVTPEPSLSSNIIASNEEDSSVGDCTKDSKNTSIEELEERPTANWIRRQLQYFAQARREKSESKTRSSATSNMSSPPYSSSKGTSMLNASSQSQPNVSPLTSLENASHHLPLRLKLNQCLLSAETGVPIFIEKCIRFIEEHGLTIEGLYRISGYKNQVEFIIQKLVTDPNCDLNSLQIPASAVATALKDMMRKLDEPILSLEQFDECQTLTIEQLREQKFSVLQKALRRTNELKYRTNRAIFKHLHFVAQHAPTTHMDSSNLAVLWWPNLFQPQFHDLRTAEQICQKAKPLVQAIIDNYSIIFSIDP